MSISSVSLSSSARSNLLALQNTSDLLKTTEERLSSGKKVNSALDDATSYFQSKGFLNSANDLSTLKNSMSTAVQTITAATDTLDAVESVVAQMQSLASSALQTSDTDSRSGYAEQFNALMTQLDYLVSDSTFNGINLLEGGTNNLIISFNSDASTSLTVTTTNVTSAGLGITTAASDWAAATNINVAVSQLQTALTTLRTEASSLGNNNTIVQTRLDFTSTMITTLQTASDNLVLADTNEEGANLQALQAQSQLGVVALGISGTQASAILRLF
jgi:flagellin-like hook-associated protein FlgL